MSSFQIPLREANNSVDHVPHPTSRESKFSAHIEGLNTFVASHLMEYAQNLGKLASGQAESIEEEWVLACLVMVGTPPNTRQLFPNAKTDEFICVKKKIVHLPPDRPSNEYLINRIAGKPSESVVHSGGVAVAGLHLFANLTPEAIDERLRIARTARTLTGVSSEPDPVRGTGSGSDVVAEAAGSS